LSSNHTQLTVQFFWQPRAAHEPGSRIDLLTEPELSTGLRFTGKSWLTVVGDNGSSQFICTGDRFTFTTDDPVDHPLPSWDLLEMQWFLQRLVGMCGAAGWPSLELDDDDTDDGDMSCVPVLTSDDTMETVDTSSEIISDK